MWACNMFEGMHVVISTAFFFLSITTILYLQYSDKKKCVNLISKPAAPNNCSITDTIPRTLIFCHSSLIICRAIKQIHNSCQQNKSPLAKYRKS